MNHLHFVQSIEPLEGGGLGKAALELSAAMNGTMDKSSLVTTCAGQSQSGIGWQTYSRCGPTRAFFSPDLHKNAAKLVFSNAVIHAHGFYVASNWLIGREARRQKKPMVCHVHGMFEPWIISRSRFKKRVAGFLFEDRNMNAAKLWRALTEKEADQIRAQGIKAPIVVCPNGVDLEMFGPVQSLRTIHRESKDRKILLFLARLHPKKGLDLLFRAWSKIDPKIRREWKIVIAGPDELNHLSDMLRLVKELQLENEVEFLGSVTGELKLRTLAKADAFVLPSRSEGFSVAVLEAMACELPVVLTHACNFPSLAPAGAGWCVDVSIEGVFGGLQNLLSCSDSDLKQRGLIARKMVEMNYTWPTIAQQIRTACHSL